MGRVSGYGREVRRPPFLYEVVQLGLGEDAHRGAGVGGEVVPLGWRQGGVEHDRDEADAGRTHGRTYEVG